MIAVGDALQYRSPGAEIWRTAGTITRAEPNWDFYCVGLNDLGHVLAKDGFPMAADWACEVRWSGMREIVISRKLLDEPRVAHCLRVLSDAPRVSPLPKVGPK